MNLSTPQLRQSVEVLESKSCYNYEIIKDISNSLTNLTETLFIEIKQKSQKNVIIGCIYRHHDTSFLDKYLIITLDKLSKQPNKISALMGDFNIDLAKYSSHAETSEFYDLLSSHGYRPLILQPARVISTSANLIDNIFINDMNCHSTGGNITSSVSDHYFQFSQLDIFGSLNNKYTIKYARDYRNFNKREFSEELSNIDWNYINNNNNNIGTNRSYNLFYYKVEKILDEIAPYRKMTKNELRLEQRPRITCEILQSMRKRDNLYKSMAREKDSVLKLEISNSYKLYRNLIVTLLKQSKKNYYSSYFIENQNNVKKTWDEFRNLINVSKKKTSLPTKIIYKNEQKNCNMDIANSFNDFFINIGKTIESNITQSKTSFKSFLKNANEKSIFLRPCDQIEVLLIINGLKSSKAPEPNSISSGILVEFSNFLIEPLTTII